MAAGERDGSIRAVAVSLAGFAALRPSGVTVVTNFVPRPLSVADDETFKRWVNTPEYDIRTIQEFAADGGRPVGPPNRYVR